MHYAKKGIITPRWNTWPARKRQTRMDGAVPARRGREQRLMGNPMGARFPEIITPEFVRDEVARGRAIIPPTSTTPRWSRWRLAATSW